MSKTVETVGSGIAEEPIRPDYDGDYKQADYHDDGTVTIVPINSE